MSYEVNILVNGSRCKQYSHNGKLFIEAKKGSEYSIEIKNNTWQRILAVCSVDGLDILNGKKAEENGNGYVINGNGSLKADGFRVSNEKVAKFLFDYKGGSYAASKEDGSERNVGVIGIRLFTEKVKPLPPVPLVIKEEHHHHHHHDHYPKYPNYPWDSPTIWGSEIRYGTNAAPGATRGLGEYLSNTTMGGPTMDCCDSNPVTDSEPLGFCDMASENLYSKTLGSPRRMASAGAPSPLRSHAVKCSVQPETKGFDMGTKWGEAKESRVIEVEFEKGILALTTNIYYASRQSLLEMGVPLGSEKQVSFPEPFSDGKYAKPPTGWNG
jgi:hypothetical protein